VVDRHHEALGLADEVLGRALRAGATEAEVLVGIDDGALTRFANSEIHQNVADLDRTVNLRFVLGRRIAVVSTARTDDEGLRALVEGASEAARVVEEHPDWAGLPDPGPDPVEQPAGAWSEGTAAATPEFRAERARAVIAAADAVGSVAYGSFETADEAIAIANSKGIRVAQRRTSATLITVHMSPDGGTGYAEDSAVDATRIDAAALGEEAATTSRAMDRPVALPAGDYPVVLGEYAVVDITDNLAFLGFSALAVEEGRSFFEHGRRIGSDLVTIVDDAVDPAGFPSAFDYEGVGKTRVVMVERGVCGEVVYDAQTAAKAGRRSTGHGLPAPNTYGPLPLNTIMAAGATPRAELVAGMGRGLLVNRFHYTNPVHPKLAIVTGMTRDGLFLVEDGRIVGPVRNLRFTQSYLDALAAVTAVGSTRRAVKGFLGASLVPALRIDGWTFTGVTEH
jgi:PmbA protein